MTHDEASLILVDRHFGRLDAPARSDLDAHVASCAASGAALDTLRRLAAPGGTADRSPHLPAGRIAAIALGTPDRPGEPAACGELAAGDEPAASDVERRHLESCASCAAEAAACRASVLEARAARAVGAESRPRRVRPFIPATLAAALLAGILGYPAYRGLVDLPRARQKAAAAESLARRNESEIASLRDTLDRERAAASTPDQGEIDLALYLDVVRGAPGRTPAITLRPGARTVTILLEASVTRPHGAGGPQRFEIRDRDGRTVWSGGVPVAAEGEHGGTDRLLALLVPARALPPGGYVLTLGGSGPSGAETRVEAPFSIVAAAGSQRQAP
jgi:hypothetical protein